jgi:hypothetical protein
VRFEKLVWISYFISLAAIAAAAELAAARGCRRDPLRRRDSAASRAGKRPSSRFENLFSWFYSDWILLIRFLRQILTPGR